jgi:hypothetical protein
MLASPGKHLVRSYSKQYFKIKKYDMKRVFFAILAISMLSTSFAFAGKGKRAKKTGTQTECPKDCPRSMGCGH